MYTGFESDFATRRGHLLLLIHLVRHSEAPGEYKREVINTLADAVGLARTEARKILRHAKKHKLALPKTESSRLGCFYHLLFALRAEGNLERKEQKLCRSVGFRLGLNPLMINTFLRLTERSRGRQLPVKKFIDAVKAHLN